MSQPAPVALAGLLLLCLWPGCSDDTQSPLDQGRDRPRLDAGIDAVRELSAGDGPGEAGQDQTMVDRSVDQLPLPDRGPDQPAGSGPLRVGTLNLYCLFDSPDLRAEGIAAEVKNRNLDALALQEICETVAAPADNMGGKLTAALKVATGVEWEVRWAKSHVSWYDKYNEGVGILARKGAILAWGEQSLFKAADFQRKVVWGKIATPRGSFYLYSTHLNIADWTERVKQVQDILKVVNTHLVDNLPQVVAGDFNDKDWTGPIQTMLAGPPTFTDAMKTKHPTSTPGSIGCPNTGDRIDYIFIRSASLKSLVQVEQLAKQYQGVCLSDHVGLFAEFHQS